MTDIESLRTEYVSARRDVARAEGDVSQATTLLASLEAAAATVRRGEHSDGVEDAIADLEAEIAGWSYDIDEIPAPDRPTFGSFDIETPDEIPEILLELFEERERDEFDAVLSLLRAVVAGGGEEFSDLARLLEALEAAFDDAVTEDDEGTEANDEDAEARFEETIEELFEWLDERELTIEDLSELAADGRGPTDRDYLERLQSTSGRQEAIETLEEAFAEPEEESFAAARAPIAGGIRAVEAFAAVRRDALGDVTGRLTDAYPESLDDELDGMAGETPILLLPTRLETRFVETADGQHDYELKVRVYPDDVHVDTHEPELTDEERRWGVHFWQQVWWASHDLDAEDLKNEVPEELLEDVDLSAFPTDPEQRHDAVLERAWNQLVERFDPEQAAWIKRQLAPATEDALLDGPHEPVADVDFDALYDAPDRRPDAWTRRPRARAMPDQWIAFAETSGTTVTARSQPVSRPLSVGPDPDRLGTVTGEADTTALSDDEMGWVFDFDAAVDAGMGLTIPLSEGQVSNGVDRLVVVGVSTALDATEGGTTVAELLQAHQYTDGLSFVEPGTPTNDTRERGAGTAPGDPPSAFELACGDARGPLGADSDGARAAELLGFDPSSLGAVDKHVFEGVRGAGRSHDAAAEAMNAALWPATWGYYLPHMLAPTRWTAPYRPRPEFLRWLESYRRHFVSYVRARGPLPTLRVGDQPYGVVPTTDLDSWRSVDAYSTTPEDDLPDEADGFVYERLPDRNIETDLVDRLESARPVWADATTSVPSIESPDAPETVVTDLLAMAGTSYGYRLRELLGEDAMSALLDDSDDVGADVDAASRTVMQVLQRYFPGAETPRVGELLADSDAPLVYGALVGDDLGSYLRALRTESHGTLRHGPPGVGLGLETPLDSSAWLVRVLFDLDDASLLEVLLYVGLLEEYRLGRVRLGMHYEHFGDVEEGERSWRETPWGLFPEPMTYDETDLTLWRALDQSVPQRLMAHPDLDRDTTFGDALRQVPEIDRPFAAVLDSYDTLRTVDEGLAERLLRETLDVSSHRFDAWATSVATRRLHGMREVSGGGLYVGAYGYVENLEREGESLSAGYIQAPSVGQATTAAVLRSGHDARSDAYGDALAVDLSADRVRDATDLIDAVRDGHPLGELLGYRFERGLHENYPAVDLDQFVPVFRSLAPLVEGKVDRDGMAPSDAAAEREVLDGVALVERWRNGAIPWGQPVGTAGTSLPPAQEGNDAYVAIRDELEALEASLDAVSDVLTAESLHQLVNGNPERAGGSLDALSRGEAPSDLSVTETPRTGTACTHRLVALLDDEATTWGPDDAPQAAAEPALNAWTGTLLGDHTRFVCRAAFTPRPTAIAGSGDGGATGDGSGGGEGGSNDGENVTSEAAPSPDWRVTTIRLSDLGLCPLDLVYLVEAEEGSWHSELEERIAYRLHRERSDVDPGGEIRVSFAPPDEWPDPSALGVDPDVDVGFGVLLEAVRGVREVVTSGRAATARDLKPPGEAGDPGLLKGPLQTRADTAETTLRDAVDAMDALTALFEASASDGDAAAGAASRAAADTSEFETLGSLIEALDGLPSQLLSRVDARLQSFDPEQAVRGLLELAEVAHGNGVLLARDREGRLVVDPDEQTVVGLAVARPGNRVRVRASIDGRPELFETHVERDGTFTVAFDFDEVERGDRIDLRIQVQRGPTVRETATFERVGDERSFVLEELLGIAALATALGALVTSTSDVRATLGSLDESVVREGMTHVDADHWPAADARTHLETVLEVDGLELPGFDTPSGWRDVGEIATALAEDRLTREVLLESPLRDLAADPTDLERTLAGLRSNLIGGLGDLRDAIEAAGTDPTSALGAAGLESLREALLVAADYGVHGSVPVSATGATTDDIESLTAQADSVAEECADRLTAAGDAGADAEGQRDRLQALFGESFTVLAPFAASNAGELQNALEPDHTDTLLETDPLAAETWFQRVARIRDVPREFGRALTYGESLGDLSPADGSRFQVAQLPYRDPDAWVGLPDAWTGEPPTGKLSIVAHVRGSQSTDSLVGLFVDEFLETVPNDAETTGMSFHYDKPGNRAPQTMLLAVPPTDDDWSLQSLADIVTESVDLAKLRTVDRDALDAVGHLLPALTLATNETTSPGGPDTASVDADDLGPEWWYLATSGGGS